MMKYSINKAVNSILLQHVIFWIAVITLLLYPDISSNEKDVYSRVMEDGITILVIGVSVYVNLLFLIPIFLRKRKYFLYVLVLFTLLMFVSALDLYSSIYFFKKDFSVHFAKNETLFYQQAVLIFSSFLMILFFVIITTFFKLLRDWVKLQDSTIKMKEMERQHLEAELNSLKAQINPHFLFNTLNNLYSLSLDESPKTPDMILKLSDLMRYIIYDCRDNKVLAKKEIEFVTNYLSLEKLRLGESVSVDFEVVGDPQIYIAPLLFINFLENAFKHSRKTEGSFIRVKFDFSTPNSVLFSIENSIYPEAELADSEYSGIGIQNVQKRLSLLYPNHHVLSIISDQEVYKVQLNILCYE